MKWFKQNKRMVYSIPSFFFPLSITIYGFFMALSESVRNSFGFTLRNYMQLFKNPVFWDSFLYSIKITLISTCFSIVIGLWLTRYLFHYFRKSHWKILVWIPLVFPHFVWGYMMILLFSQTGWISTLFYKWDIISDFTQFPILILVLTIVFVYKNFQPKSFLCWFGFALLLSGSIGNLIDRIRFGYVIDFISFRWWPAIFNIADIEIRTGALLLVYQYLTQKIQWTAPITKKATLS